MPAFIDHLVELRNKLLLSFGACLLGAAVADHYHDALISFMLRPVRGQQLFFLSPLDAFLFILKIDLSMGCILALPVINWCVLSFVKPAMQKSSWVLFSALYCMAAVLILCGLAYAYFIMVPRVLAFLLSIHVAGVVNMITANNYLNFLLVQSLITALVFQVPLFIVGGACIGALDLNSLASKRRYIYVGGLIVLAVVTPTTDIFSLGCVALPALVIFEGSLVAGRIVYQFAKKEPRTHMQSLKEPDTRSAVP